MAKTRSPSYPSISLKEAIEKVSAIYHQNYQSPVSRAVAAELMGYGGLNGKSLGVLAALAKYGLLEGRGDDTRVSDLALAIIAHEPGAPERGTAIREAAGKPDLFVELDARFSGGKASDAAMRSYLITQKFIPQAADAVVRSYRETKQLVSLESPEYPVLQPQTDDTGARKLSIQEALDTPVSEIKPPPFWQGDIDDLDEPYEIAITGSSKAGKKIAGRFSFRDQDSVDELISVLEAMKKQLPKKELKAPDA